VPTAAARSGILPYMSFYVFTMAQALSDIWKKLVRFKTNSLETFALCAYPSTDRMFANKFMMNFLTLPVVFLLVKGCEQVTRNQRFTFTSAQRMLVTAWLNWNWQICSQPSLLFSPEMERFTRI
jgi:hypothetical protein